MEFLKSNNQEQPGLFSRKFWVLAVGVVLIATAMIMIFSPASAGTNATYLFSGNLVESVEITQSGVPTPFTFAIGNNTWNNYTIIHSNNVGIKFTAIDVLDNGKGLATLGKLASFNGTYDNSKYLGSSYLFSVGSGTPTQLNGTPIDVLTGVGPAVAASKSVKINQYVSPFDVVLPAGSVYQGKISVMAVVTG